MKKLALSLLGSVMATGIVAPASQAQVPFWMPGSEAMREVPQSQTQVQLSYAPVVKETAPAVVNVFTSRTVIRRTSQDFFDEMFGMRRAPRERTESSLGSGVIVRSNGKPLYLLSNVVDDIRDRHIAMMRSWIWRRSASIWVSPGPPMNPAPPRWRSRWVHDRTSRLFCQLRCARST